MQNWYNLQAKRLSCQFVNRTLCGLKIAFNTIAVLKLIKCFTEQKKNKKVIALIITALFIFNILLACFSISKHSQLTCIQENPQTVFLPWLLSLVLKVNTKWKLEQLWSTVEPVGKKTSFVERCIQDYTTDRKDASLPKIVLLTERYKAFSFIKTRHCLDFCPSEKSVKGMSLSTLKM